MKFLIDAHLPPSLRAVFRAAGHDVIHTLDLPDQNASRDGILNEVSMNELRVVVTKDTDFYHFHLLHGRPWKLVLVLVRTGNLGLKARSRCLKHICLRLKRRCRPARRWSWVSKEYRLSLDGEIRTNCPPTAPTSAP